MHVDVRINVLTIEATAQRSVRFLCCSPRCYLCRDNTHSPLDQHLFPSYIHIVCIVNVNYAVGYSKSHSGVLVLFCFGGEILIFNESAFHPKQLTFIL